MKNSLCYFSFSIQELNWTTKFHVNQIFLYIRMCNVMKMLNLLKFPQGPPSSLLPHPNILNEKKKTYCFFVALASGTNLDLTNVWNPPFLFYKNVYLLNGLMIQKNVYLCSHTITPVAIVP